MSVQPVNVEWALPTIAERGAEPTLRRLYRLKRRPQAPPLPETCELCSAPLREAHEHVLELTERRILCACDACAILFDRPASPLQRGGWGGTGRYRRVPRDVTWLRDFRMSDLQWKALQIPIGLAFIFPGTPAGRVVAMYPSPAGATESLLQMESWNDLLTDNPALRELTPDVEALLINRLGCTPGAGGHKREPEYFRAPIDQCYRLAGLIRTHWRGFSGGTRVWDELDNFFDSMRKSARCS